ncbi:MAG: hypothetical protein OXK80_06200 [Bdellovibrionales bacterium]|nr:hypothetical protein [Bdellovibrionales bacterium]
MFSHTIQIAKYCTLLFLTLTTGLACKPKVTNNPERKALAPVWEQSEYIFHNKMEQRVTAIDRESGREVILNNGECVFIGSYHSLALRDQNGLICDFFRENGNQNTNNLCSDKITDIIRANSFIPERNGKFSYIYFYNIINTKNIFEQAGQPKQEDESFTHACHILSEDTYD